MECAGLTEAVRRPGKCQCGHGLDCIQRTAVDARCWAGEFCPPSWACTKVTTASAETQTP
eukprot:2290294-Rhodomonas_salina.1